MIESRPSEGGGIAIEEPVYSAEYRHSWALVVGIDQYKDPDLPPLSTGVKGARAVARLLHHDLGFDAERIILLENEEATQRAIRRAFVDPLAQPDKVGPDDRVLVYFGGHGLTYDTAEGEIGCIAPYDIERRFWDTAIPMDELTRLANRIHAKHVLFLLDACFSGFATTREISPGVQRQAEDFLTRPARQVITAGMRDQPVLDLWGPGGHSLFTGFLLEGLAGVAPAPGGILRAFHLAGYLQDQVAQHSRSRQTPQYAALIGGQGGDFVFSVREIVELPQWIVTAATSDDATERMVAVSRLHEIARGDDPRLTDAALEHLQRLAGDDSSLVQSAAAAALAEMAPAPAPPAPEVVREELVVPEPPEPEPPPEVPIAEPIAEKQPPLEAPPLTHPAPRERRGLPAWAWVSGAVVGGALLVGVLALAGLFGPRATPSPEPTQEPALTAIDCRDAGMPEIACTGVEDNDDWTPVIQEFNGVEMALVPAGCFMMGSTSGKDEEQPVHEVCFEEPFWIDVYEVTNEQFGAVGCADWSSEPQQPRICVTWFEARDHCESRGARLPTEAEWEYAARGPDGLIYPWGNDFVGDNVVYNENSGGHTANVGSKPGGGSWVGAFDLSGNVWEWVNDWYDAGYYSTLADGAVNPQGPGSGDARVLRGGAWDDYTYHLRAARRNGNNAGYGDNSYGFRCALSY
jgi:formylglycine-generating enzyme required for sulfatase activity